MVDFTPPRRRGELGDHEGHTVSWLELYFDLIFVVSIIQAGNLLSNDVSFHGLMRFSIVFTMLWWSWISTTTYFNSYVVDDVLHRIIVLTQMFVIGHMAILVGQGFSGHSGWFATAYAINRLLVAAMYARTLRHFSDRQNFANSQIALSLFAVAAMLLANLVTPNTRYWIWVAILGVEIGLSFLPRFHQFLAMEFDLEHLSERFALFTIIVLGESFIKTIGILTIAEIEVMQAEVFGAFGFVTAVAIWWTYFDDIAAVKVKTHWSAKLVWAYIHLPMTLAITAFGVGSKKLAVQPLLDPMPGNQLLLITCSVSVFLVCVAILDIVTSNVGKAFSVRARCITRIIAATAVASIGFLCQSLPALVPATAMLLVGLSQIGFELLAARRQRASSGITGIKVDSDTNRI